MVNASPWGARGGATLSRGWTAFTAGLFFQKSAITSPIPDASISTSEILKQTDNVVSACHIGPHGAAHEWSRLVSGCDKGGL